MNIDYKIIFTDLDGTLLSQKKDISDFTAEQLKKLQRKIPVILVSARMPKSMKYIQSKINGEKNPMICYNGALLVQGDDVISSHTITPDFTNTLYEISSSKGIKLGLYDHDNWFTETVSERIEIEIFNTKAQPTITPLTGVIESYKAKKTGFHKIMCMGSKLQIDELFAQLEHQFADAIQMYRSNDTIIELSPHASSKLSGIETLLEKNFNLSLAEAMAFGDNYNDIEMIKKVGHGVAVANARNEVKQQADAIAEDYKSDGVAKYLKKAFRL